MNLKKSKEEQVGAYPLRPVNSTDLEALGSVELLDRVKRSVQNEKQANAWVIRCLAEVERREAYLKWGYGSLYAFVTEELGYDSASASRRVQAARASVKVPDLCEKIGKGEVSLATVQKVGSYCYHEGRERKKEFSAREMKRVFEQVGGLSAARAEEALVEKAKSSRFAQPKKETNRAVKGGRRVISFTVAAEHQELMELGREAMSHKFPGASLEEIYREALRFYVERRHPRVKAQLQAEKLERRAAKRRDKTAEREQNKQKNRLFEGEERAVKLKALQHSNSDKNSKDKKKHSLKNDMGVPALRGSRSRYFPALENRKIWLKRYDGRGCVYVSPVTGKRCGTRHKLQRDHVKPFALGGSNTAVNARVYCQRHNLGRRGGAAK